MKALTPRERWRNNRGIRNKTRAQGMASANNVFFFSMLALTLAACQTTGNDGAVTAGAEAQPHAQAPEMRPAASEAPAAVAAGTPSQDEQPKAGGNGPAVCVFGTTLEEL